MPNYMTELSPDNNTHVYQVKDKEAAPIDLLKDTVGWVGKNDFNFDAFKAVLINRGTAVFTDNSIALTATSADCYTEYSAASYPVGARIPVEEGKKIVLTWAQSGGTSNDKVLIMPNGALEGRVNAGANEGILEYTPTSGISFVTIRLSVATSGSTITYSNIMCRKASIIDSTFEPYHPSVKQTLRDAEVIEGKNLLNVIEVVDSNRNVAYTVNRNKNNSITSIVANGTPTSGANAFLRLRAFVKAGTYRFSGITGGSSSTYWVDITNDSGTAISLNTYEAKEITISADQIVRFFFNIKDGYTASNVTIYPMLTDLSEDTVFEPYYIPVKDSKMSYADNGLLGAKNIFGTNDVYSISANTTADVTNDGKIINVKNTSAGTWRMVTYRVAVEPNCDYILTSEVTIASGASMISISVVGGSDIATKTLSSGEKANIKFNSGNNTKLAVKLLCTTGTSTTGDVTYTNTMIRLASDPDTTFRPYAKTNKELTDMVGVKIGTITSSYLDTARAYLKKQGNIVNASIVLSSVTASENEQIATIPEGFRPSVNFVVLGYNMTDGIICPIQIQADGKVLTLSSLTAKNLRTSATWITS